MHDQQKQQQLLEKTMPKSEQQQTNLVPKESEATLKQFEHGGQSLRDSVGKKTFDEFEGELGTATDRVRLAQIEAAIDTLLA